MAPSKVKMCDDCGAGVGEHVVEYDAGRTRSVHNSPCSKYRLSSNIMALITSGRSGEVVATRAASRDAVAALCDALAAEPLAAQVGHGLQLQSLMDSSCGSCRLTREPLAAQVVHCDQMFRVWCAM